MKVFFILLFVLVSAPLTASAREAFSVGSSLVQDLAFQGIIGADVDGLIHDDVWSYGLGIQFAKAPYDAVKVEHHAADTTPLTPDAVDATSRKGHIGKMFSIGPQLGLQFPVAGHEKLLELYSVRFLRMNFNDTDSSEAFSGWGAQFRAALGYPFRKGILSLGFDYNLGYLRRTNYLNIITHLNYLNLQWWNFNFGYRMRF